MAGHVTAPVRHSRTRRAWIAVWTIPVGFVVAMVVGEGLVLLTLVQGIARVADP